MKRSWRLNERHYGALQGKDKKQTLDEYGEEQFMLWRRSFDTPPPPLDDSSEFSQAADPRYADLGDELPRTECLKDVIARFLPYWEAEIVPDLQSGRTVLVAAHGNSLRALVKHLDQISDEDIAGLNIPTGMPLVYRLDDDMRPTVPVASTSTPRPPPPPQPSPTRVAERPDRGSRGLEGRARTTRRAGVDRRVAAGQSRGRSPVTTKTTRLATETAWSAMRS